ncbi:M28 family peptidase [Arenimonas oryziterrae]|uniref:M28 family peptidase n=1 Tax=Arenimonas oryziterrae TaxID=498055 RepID=UPI0005242006|nr:M28 family peptidase [Arenimonas oryziterrae]
MRPLVFALSVLLSASAGAADFDARALRDAEQLRAGNERGTDAYAIVESLTTEVGPRMAGTPAYDRAVAWAQAKFKALGYDRVYLEPVSFPVWERRHESAEVLAPYPQRLLITALGGSVGTGGKVLEAEVVEFANLEALKAAPADSLKGKIAYISNRMERFKDGHGYGPAVSARGGGASEASKKGAVGYLLRSIGTDSARMPHTGTMRYAEGVTKIPAAALSNPDADLLSNMLRRGKPVTLRLDIDAGMNGTKTSYNVIGEIRGRSKPDEVVVIGGHLDSWDLGTGAIDDGAGVAITMSAGAMIGRLDRAPRRTIRVIAFANEEQGLFGGRAYADAHLAQVDAHQVGAESDFGAGRVYAFRAGTAPEAQPVIAKIGEMLAPLGIVYEPGRGGPGPDVGPLAGKGMPWAQLAQDGTDYFDYHHTANDTLDKIDTKAMDQQAAAYAVMAYLSAETDVDFGKSPPLTGEE